MVTKQKQGIAARVGRVETTAGAMAVYEYGHGVPLVLLHANAHDHADYQPVIPALAEKYRVIAIDAPGHGASAWAFDPAEITAVKIADAQAEVVARLGLKRPAFIGNSIGGFTALRYALKNPGNTRGLVLVNSGGFNSSDLKAKIFCNLMGLTPVAGALWNLFPQSYLRVKTPHVKKILAKIRARKNTATVQMFAAIWKSFLEDEHNLLEAAKQVTAPTLLAWGKRDPVIPLSIGRVAQKCIPHAQLHVFDTGHEPFAEAPEDFLRVVLPFLDSLK
ncbi:MAG: alpha/beta hydrolase [Turneriella sp.]|nr:alpha/beta hydrolase [Turneriella sp.]